MSQTQARHLQGEQRDQLVVQPSAAQLVALCRVAAAAPGLSFLIGAGWSCAFQEITHGRTHKGWLPFSHLNSTFSVPEGLPEHFQPNPLLINLISILHGNSARELCIHHHGSHPMGRQTRPGSHKLTRHLTKPLPRLGGPRSPCGNLSPDRGGSSQGLGPVAESTRGAEARHPRPVPAPHCQLWWALGSGQRASVTFLAEERPWVWTCLRPPNP